ncbi:hypothetical protein CALCODRAFT_552279 [Calocera cornea HHB12733]|uniref:Zn(2)-C6 fungal-type domain-containing protein n=1 Tax=Calocera cornea HHB12733 TaxID=1353952 RepID=A0A165K698_9BASI|nr:hypothetical protein CALCODRAFT_552279 [Calocera cornea HHB12733]
MWQEDDLHRSSWAQDADQLGSWRGSLIQYWMKYPEDIARWPAEEIPYLMPNCVAVWLSMQENRRGGPKEIEPAWCVDTTKDDPRPQDLPDNFQASKTAMTAPATPAPPPPAVLPPMALRERRPTPGPGPSADAAARKRHGSPPPHKGKKAFDKPADRTSDLREKGIKKSLDPQRPCPSPDESEDMHPACDFCVAERLYCFKKIGTRAKACWHCQNRHKDCTRVRKDGRSKLKGRTNKATTSQSSEPSYAVLAQEVAALRAQLAAVTKASGSSKKAKTARK